MRGKILSFQDLEKNINDLNQLEREITLYQAQIIQDLSKKHINELDLIGFHGQTIFHDSDLKVSRQLGDGKLLSQLTNKIVVNNFRKEDLLNGGQGAPLTPIFHKMISKILNMKFQIKLPIHIINIGGITNITQINSLEEEEYSDLLAADISPGNCLIDEWVRKNSKLKYDHNGDIAKSGSINKLILNQALDNFENKNYHKSLDVNDFDLSFIKGLSFEDGCATITKFSACLIARGIEWVQSLHKIENNLFLVSGGGRKNIFLLKCINDELRNKNIRIENIDQFQFDGDFLESQAFAYLAVRTYLKLPISFQSTTRCKSPTIGGTINKNF